MPPRGTNGVPTFIPHVLPPSIPPTLTGEKWGIPTRFDLGFGLVDHLPGKIKIIGLLHKAGIILDSGGL